MGLLDVDDEESMFQQTAVYWAPGKKDAHGQPTWLDPVELPCRWNNSDSRSIATLDEVLAIAATVEVAQDLERGGALLLGALSSSMTSDARAFGASEIMRFTKNPSREAGHFVRTAFLARA